MNTKISLYECFNAKVHGNHIYCAKRHSLSSSKHGDIAITRLVRGEPLILSPCQNCLDFDRMGEPLIPEDRGWVKTL